MQTGVPRPPPVSLFTSLRSKMCASTFSIVRESSLGPWVGASDMRHFFVAGMRTVGPKGSTSVEPSSEITQRSLQLGRLKGAGP